MRSIRKYYKRQRNKQRISANSLRGRGPPGIMTVRPRRDRRAGRSNRTRRSGAACPQGSHGRRSPNQRPQAARQCRQRPVPESGCAAYRLASLGVVQLCRSDAIRPFRSWIRGSPSWRAHHVGNGIHSTVLEQSSTVRGHPWCSAPVLSSVGNASAVDRMVRTVVTPVHAFTVSRLTTACICNKNDSHYELCRPTPWFHRPGRIVLKQ